ncbi:MAG: hypothetical protein ABI162_13585 [Luteolibacter sp.]
MNVPVANWTLWCRRGGTYVEFTIELGKPYLKIDHWCCDWAVGKLFPNELFPTNAHNSYLALVQAMIGVISFLKTREKAGDQFYWGPDSENLELLDDIEILFSPTYFLNARDLPENIRNPIFNKSIPAASPTPDSLNLE